MVQKVAVVTGSNKGLGFAIVKGLCQRFDGIVYLTARDKTRGLEAVKKLNEIGLRPEFHILEVTDRESISEFADFIKKRHGGFDVLVNNAAMLEWDAVYPSYDVAKRTMDVNYRSLLTIEELLYPLLRDGARVVNVSSNCGHLSNLRNQKWIETLKSVDLTTDKLNGFVDDYLQSVRNGTFRKEDFADEGKHAEHRVAKIGVTALTFIQQRKYYKRNISINAVYPGHIKTDMAQGGGQIVADEAAKVVLYLILEASPNLKGTFMWHDRKLVDWLDAEDKDGVHCCKGLW